MGARVTSRPAHPESVVLLGLSPALLEWGQYCAERNAQIAGIYDADHRAALMASLHLACSAFPDAGEALSQANLALLGQPLPEVYETNALLISLGFTTPAASVRLDGNPAGPTLSGPLDACHRVRQWLGALAPHPT